MSAKSMTLRLPEDQAKELELIAAVDGKSMSDEIREALTAHLNERRNDPEFQQRLKQVLANNRTALRRLSRAAGTVGDRLPHAQ